MPQERIPQQEQDLDEGRSRDFSEDFNLDNFLSAPPETRHAWQAEFEENMMRGATNPEGDSEAKRSFADDIDFAISAAAREQRLNSSSGFELFPDSSGQDTRRQLYLPRDAEHAIELIGNNTYSAPGMAELEVWWRVAAGEDPRTVWEQVIGAYDAMDGAAAGSKDERKPDATNRGAKKSQGFGAHVEGSPS